MRGIVIDFRDSYAAVLSDDGSIVKLKNQNYTIGQVIDLKEQSFYQAKKHTKWLASAISAAAVVCVLGTTAWAYATPYSYVSLDVNPSVEYSLNRFRRVLTVKAVNDDGKEIVEELGIKKLKNKPIEEAISQTVLQIAENGYFEGAEEGGIVIATAGDNSEDAENLAEELQQQVEETVEETGDNVAVEAVSVGLERVQEARQLGVTPGKLNLVEKLQASAGDSETISTEDWLNKPVKEIMKAIKENKKAAKAGIDPEEPADSESSSSEESSSSSESESSSEASSSAASIETTDAKAAQASSKVAEKEIAASSKAAEKDAAASSKAAEKDAAASSKAAEKDAAASSKAAEKETAASSKAAEKETTEKNSKSSGNSETKSADKSDNGSNKGSKK